MIDGKTTTCCVIGNPIKHSLSPTMHNAAYEKLGLNFVYVAFRVENVGDAVIGMRGLGIRGMSVTIPHKVSIIKYLDRIDSLAKNIGAVNTVVNENGKLLGYNTDCEGAMRALKEITDIRGKSVVLIGAGGAARAIAFGLKQEGALLTILNRTKKRAEELAGELGSAFGDLSMLSSVKNAAILINATATGMNPNTNESLVQKEHLRPGTVVFDIVYNPHETMLIREAKTIGCKVVYGYKMFLYQAVAQFELFTNAKATPDVVSVMENALVDHLERRKP